MIYMYSYMYMYNPGHRYIPDIFIFISSCIQIWRYPGNHHSFRFKFSFSGFIFICIYSFMRPYMHKLSCRASLVGRRYFTFRISDWLKKGENNKGHCNTYLEQNGREVSDLNWTQHTSILRGVPIIGVGSGCGQAATADKVVFMMWCWNTLSWLIK